MRCQRFEVCGSHAQSPPRNSVQVANFLSCYRNTKCTAQRVTIRTDVSLLHVSALLGYYLTVSGSPMKSVQKLSSAYTNKNVKLTPRSRALSEAFYRTRRFVTDCTSANYLPPFLRRTKRTSPFTRPCKEFRNIVNVYGKELFAARPATQEEDHPLSAIRDCFFFSSIFEVTLHIWGRSSTRNLRTQHSKVIRNYLSGINVRTYLSGINVRTYLSGINVRTYLSGINVRIYLSGIM